MEKDFEVLWKENRKHILESDPEYKKIVESYKMKSGADWLLFGIPVMAAIGILETSPFGRELFNWLAGVAAAVVTFAICVAVKSMITGNRSVSELEEDLKKHCHEHYMKTGKLTD